MKVKCKNKTWIIFTVCLVIYHGLIIVCDHNVSFKFTFFFRHFRFLLKSVKDIFRDEILHKNYKTTQTDKLRIYISYVCIFHPYIHKNVDSSLKLICKINRNSQKTCLCSTPILKKYDLLNFFFYFSVL